MKDNRERVSCVKYQLPHSLYLSKKKERNLKSYESKNYENMDRKSII